MENMNNIPDNSRRSALKTGFAVSALAALSLTTLGSANASTDNDTKHDMAILNAALDLENQAIWAYGVAAGKLSNSKVGNVIKSLALRNQDMPQQFARCLVHLIRRSMPYRLLNLAKKLAVSGYCPSNQQGAYHEVIS